ncbi:hypothetical protein ACBV55_22920 (plasmid) [Franconibacter pulveris]
MATLGELYPQINTCRPEKVKKMPEREQGRVLQSLYPELESWQPRFLARAWKHWRTMTRQEPALPETRDERFPEFLVGVIQDKMVEVGAWK